MRCEQFKSAGSIVELEAFAQKYSVKKSHVGDPCRTRCAGETKRTIEMDVRGYFDKYLLLRTASSVFSPNSCKIVAGGYNDIQKNVAMQDFSSQRRSWMPIPGEGHSLVVLCNLYHILVVALVVARD
jgi:hypothetical protein